jgi:hypothetical protein
VVQQNGEVNGPRSRLRIAGYVSRQFEPASRSISELPSDPTSENAPFEPLEPVARSARSPHSARILPSVDRRHRGIIHQPGGRWVALVIAALAAFTVVALQQFRPQPSADEAATSHSSQAAATTVPSAAANGRAASPSALRPTNSAPDELSVSKPEAIFELADNVAEITIRTVALGGVKYGAIGPNGSGVRVRESVRNGVVTVTAELRDPGHGDIQILLNANIGWRLFIRAGVRTMNLDLRAGAVNGISLLGGVRKLHLELARLDKKLPILMAGGVQDWSVLVGGFVPVRIVVQKGAGNLMVYDRNFRGVSAGETIRSGAGPGLEIDAAAGIGSLVIASES